MSPVQKCSFSLFWILKMRWNVSPATISSMGPVPIGWNSTRYVCCPTPSFFWVYTEWKCLYNDSKTGFSSFSQWKICTSKQTASSRTPNTHTLCSYFCLDVAALVWTTKELIRLASEYSTNYEAWNKVLASHDWYYLIYIFSTVMSELHLSSWVIVAHPC